jgi:NAD(P)-dependent dehydrogenase (short-subunit alcohol dehydrogenase family)
MDNTKHVIVITGCDSGFGDLSSRRLASLGFQVVSGCITSEGADRLNGTVSLFVFFVLFIILMLSGCFINHL